MKQGWEVKRLGEICEVSTGKSNTEDAVENGEYAFFDRSKIIKKSSKYLFDCDAIIVAGEGQTFLPKFYSGKFDLHQRAYAIFNFNKDVSVYYAYKYLIHFHKYFEEVAVGATAKSLRLRHFQDMPIPIPPLQEQQRIVAVLDEVFEGIAKAKKNAEQNLRNARELFDSYLQSVFESRGDGWEEKKFDEICVLQRGFDLPTHSRNKGGFPLVSSNGITDRIDLWKVKAPGVVTGRSGTIGNVHFIDEDYWPLNTALYIKEFHGNCERFVYYFLKQFDLGKYSSGAGVPTLNRNNVHSELVWFPKSITDQQTIVTKLDALSTETKRLEAIYQKKIDDLEELRRAILQKAFNGEL